MDRGDRNMLSPKTPLQVQWVTFGGYLKNIELFPEEWVVCTQPLGPALERQTSHPKYRNSGDYIQENHRTIGKGESALKRAHAQTHLLWDFVQKQQFETHLGLKETLLLILKWVLEKQAPFGTFWEHKCWQAPILQSHSTLLVLALVGAILAFSLLPASTGGCPPPYHTAAMSQIAGKSPPPHSFAAVPQLAEWIPSPPMPHLQPCHS